MVSSKLTPYTGDKSKNWANRKYPIGIGQLNISTMLPNMILINAYLPEYYKIRSEPIRKIFIRYGVLGLNT